MGLLHHSTPSPVNEGDVDVPTHSSPLASVEYIHNLHEVIGDALEVFSRHLRAHN